MAGTITFTLTEQDLIAARRAQFRRRTRSRWALAYYAILLVVIWVAIFGINVVTDGGWGDAARTASLFCAMILGPITLLMLLGYGLTGYQVRRLFRQQRSLREEMQASWTDVGLDLRSVVVTASMPWSDFHGWKQAEMGFLIYINDYSCHIFPRRAFTDEQWADLEGTLVRSGLPRQGASASKDQAAAKQVSVEKAQRKWWSMAAWSSPGRVALLWIVLAFLTIVDTVVFADVGEMVSAILFLSGAPVVAALLAGWVLRLRASTLGLASIFLAIAIVFQLEWLLIRASGPAVQSDGFFGLLGGAMVLLAILAIWLRFSQRSTKRAWAAIGLLVGTIAVAGWFSQADAMFYRASAQVRDMLGIGEKDDAADKAYDAVRDIPVDRLWGAQPGLVAKAVDRLSPRVAGRPNVYAITVAAGGSQQLFAREARLARQVAAARFGADYRGGILLSNGVTDILHEPLATQDNMAAAARGVGDHMDPAQDLAFVYLVSHGSRDAELQTDLPTYDDLSPISAASVSDALRQAGIRRRVIVISACFSGSWIPALANDDTIVITAARKDRTSFGCDDSLALTYFGEAFLRGPLAKGASLRDAFEAARKAIAAREGKDHLTPSEPQLFVGRNMQALWTQAR
ncbi:YcxB family protein [Sphingomonas sp. CGMCC 1.13654]|uniref:YcxB family protein n=1 Tax=Sphingomonas chungangi TaxID=2683589 RepID=A0A838L1G0_9SPHN|nr:C13 family peptidase [Sphingomonas chungangi]MBA2933333.1 YcxB family protein [Sphingomonas chungangi]MVW54667.1 hypothetical protein [Sphingomonas chungangi]